MAAETGDVEIRGSSALARLALEFATQWPSFKFLGFGCYYAWIWLCYNSSILCHGSIALTEATTFTSSMYLSSTAALAVSLLVVAVFGKRLGRFVSSNRFVLCAAALASVATGGVAWFSGGTRPAVLYAFSIVTGLCTAWVALRLGQVYAKASTRHVIMYTAASFVFACLLYFVVQGLPHLLGLAITLLLPLAAAALTMLPDGPDSQVDEHAGHQESLSLGQLPYGMFLRLILAILVFSFIIGVTRGSAAGSVTVGSLDDQGAIIVFGTACIAGVIYLLAGLVGVDFDIDRLYYPIILLAAAGTLLTPLLGMTSALQAQILGIAYALFALVMWSLLSYVAHATGASAVQVFGFGRGASAVGNTLGWLLGYMLLPAATTSSFDILTVSLVMAFALVVVALLVFNDRVLGSALRSISARSQGGGAVAQPAATVAAATQPAPDGRPAAGAQTAAAAEAPGAGTDGAAVPVQVPGGGSVAEADASIQAAVEASHPRGGGAWVSSCNRIAERYQLTARERETLFLLAKGHTIESLAAELGVSFNTAKTHIRHVYVKTGVHTRQELIALIERTKEALD